MPFTTDQKMVDELKWYRTIVRTKWRREELDQLNPQKRFNWFCDRFNRYAPKFGMDAHQLYLELDNLRNCWSQILQPHLNEPDEQVPTMAECDAMAERSMQLLRQFCECYDEDQAVPDVVFE